MEKLDLKKIEKYLIITLILDYYSRIFSLPLLSETFISFWIYLSFLLLDERLGVFHLGLLWIVLPWIFLYMYFGEHMHPNSFNPESSCNCYPISFPLEPNASEQLTLLSNTYDSFLVKFFDEIQHIYRKLHKSYI